MGGQRAVIARFRPSSLRVHHGVASTLHRSTLGISSEKESSDLRLLSVRRAANVTCPSLRLSPHPCLPQMTLQRTAAAIDVSEDAEDRQRHQPYLNNNNNNANNANNHYRRKLLRPTVSVFSVSILLVLLFSTTINLSSHTTYGHSPLRPPQQQRQNSNVTDADPPPQSFPAASDSTATAIAITGSSCRRPQAVDPLLTVAQLDSHLQDERVTYTTGTNRNLPTPPTLANYIAFHATQLGCLTRSSPDAACADAQNRISNGVLVWECSHSRCGGVGDRMRGIRLVFLMAVATNRLFLIDWPKTRSAPFPLTTVLWPAAIDWRYDDSMLSSPAFSSSPSHHVRQLDFEQDEGYVYVSDRHMSSSGDDFDNAKKERLPFSVSDTDIPALFGSGSGSPAVIRVANRQPRSALLNLTSNPSVHQSLSGLQRTDNDAAALERRLMRVLFRASPTVDTAMRARVPTRPYVSVHARSGDDVGEAGISRLQHVAQHHEQTAQRMLRCVRNLHWYLTRKTRRRLERRREIGKGNLTVGHDEMSVEQVDVFVAADSQKFKQAFMDAAAAAAVNVDGSNAKGRSDDEEQLLGQLPVHVYTDGGRVVHVDRPNQVGASGSSGELQLLGQDQQERQQLSEEALCKGFVDVFADLFGLANAHGMAYLHSGFPVSALALSTINRWKELEVTPPYAPDECTIVKRS